VSCHLGWHSIVGWPLIATKVQNSIKPPENYLYRKKKFFLNLSGETTWVKLSSLHRAENINPGTEQGLTYGERVNKLYDKGGKIKAKGRERKAKTCWRKKYRRTSYLL
jgi:hypothetical protein